MKNAESVNPQVDSRVIAFLKGQTALTLATCADNIPHCASCFYAYSEAYNMLIFKSSAETRHIVNGLSNTNVAGAVLPDKLITGKVKGVQFAGDFIKPSDELLSDLQNTYYKRYPFAVAIAGELWAIGLNQIKFTDNTLGFGKKLLWEKHRA